MNRNRYLETFDHGPGGWVRVIDNVQPVAPVEIREGVACCFSPWWVDYNHAPPGAGYLQLLMSLSTRGPLPERVRDVGGENRFVAGSHSLDFTGAQLIVRLKGEVDLRGAKLSLLIQGNQDGKTSGWVLTGRTFDVTPDFSEQSVVLLPYEVLWTCLGSRHDRTDMYGVVPLQRVLANVNVNLYFVLFPVTPKPMGVIQGDPHLLRAGRDYPVWQSSIPEGYVLFDTLEVQFPSANSEGLA